MSKIDEIFTLNKWRIKARLYVFPIQYLFIFNRNHFRFFSMRFMTIIDFEYTGTSMKFNRYVIRVIQQQIHIMLSYQQTTTKKNIS